LRIYNDHRTSLYEVLSLSRDCDDEDIKQAYRANALLVHPDKNPHPQAKAAFEAIQDAFRTLSSPLTRGEYDKDFARRNKLTIKRVKKKVVAFFLNHFSNLQLLYVRAMRGEAEQIRVEVTAALHGNLDVVQDRVAHLQLLPSYLDRIKLLHEIIGDNWRALASSITALSLLSTT
jgi:curved DNA-binding protein CbpA